MMDDFGYFMCGMILGILLTLCIVGLASVASKQKVEICHVEEIENVQEQVCWQEYRDE